MFYDVKHFLNHDYLVKDGKIGYKEMGQITFSKSYGYKTIFAYYHHFEISKEG